MLFNVLILLCLSLSSGALESLPQPGSNDSPPTSPQPTNAIEEAVEEAKGSAYRRKQNNYFALATYSPADLIIPSKWGLTIGLLRSERQTLELEYLRGKLSIPFVVADLGQMTDQKISLIGRSYFSNNSFYLGYGLTYFDFKAHLGSEYLNSATNGYYPNADVVVLQSLGANISIGNRWTIDHNITLGIEWVSLYQPLVRTKREAEFLKASNNPEAVDDVDSAVSLVSYFPRFTFFKLQLGLLF